MSAADYVSRVNKLRDAISTISRSLNSMPLNGKDYEMFQAQEECLKKINNALTMLKSSVDEITYFYENSTRQSRKDQEDQMTRLTLALRDEWALVSSSCCKEFIIFLLLNFLFDCLFIYR